MSAKRYGCPLCIAKVRAFREALWDVPDGPPYRAVFKLLLGAREGAHHFSPATRAEHLAHVHGWKLP